MPSEQLTLHTIAYPIYLHNLANLRNNMVPMWLRTSSNVLAQTFPAVQIHMAAQQTHMVM